MIEQEKKELIERLFTEKCSCVIRNGSEVHLFRERGVKDLYRLLKEKPEFLDGAFVADKVVGKAAAALMILGGVKEVFADVVSVPAYALFRANRVWVDYRLKVDHIFNRSQTGRCPLEIRCDGLQTPEECRIQIEEFMKV